MAALAKTVRVGDFLVCCIAAKAAQKAAQNAFLHAAMIKKNTPELTEHVQCDECCSGRRKERKKR